MRKLLLLLVIAAGGGLLLPQTRERLLDPIPLVGESGRTGTAEAMLARLEHDIRQTADKVGLYPQPDVWDEWQLQTYRRVPMDPWGSNYYYDIWKDSFVVGSPGPDQEAGTPDDIRSRHRR